MSCNRHSVRPSIAVPDFEVVGIRFWSAIHSPALAVSVVFWMRFKAAAHWAVSHKHYSKEEAKERSMFKTPRSFSLGIAEEDYLCWGITHWSLSSTVRHIPNLRQNLWRVYSKLFGLGHPGSTAVVIPNCVKHVLLKTRDCRCWEAQSPSHLQSHLQKLLLVLTETILDILGYKEKEKGSTVQNVGWWGTSQLGWLNQEQFPCFFNESIWHCCVFSGPHSTCMY